MKIVVSTRYAQNSEGLAYSNGDGPREAAERISDSLATPPHSARLGFTVDPKGNVT